MMGNIFECSLPEKELSVSPIKLLDKSDKRQENIKIKTLYQEEFDLSTLKGWFISLIWPIFSHGLVELYSIVVVL